MMLPIIAVPLIFGDHLLVALPQLFALLTMLCFAVLVMRTTGEDGRSKEPRATQLFDALHEPVLVTDYEDCLTYYNTAAQAISTKDLADYIGHPIQKFLTSIDQGLEVYISAHSGIDDNVTPFEPERQSLTLPDGQIRLFDLSISPVFVDDFLAGHTILLHDVTLMTEELDAEQQAAATAREASRISSDFLAVVSHEIRTPMQAVIGMTGLLLGTDLNDEQRDYVETIHSSGDSMLSIINNVLDFSKIEAGQIELEQQSFDPVAAIEDTLKIFAGQAAIKQIELAFILGSEIPDTVLGDVTRFRQVLSNLVGNAIKFTDHGEVAIYINSQKHHDDVLLHVRVRDTGIGIPPERMNRLFQNFSQVDASTTRVYGGTGLGLAICKRLCELMGGDVWVESHSGIGSTFNFTVVFAHDPNSEGRTQIDDTLAGRRALVVDDNAASREMYSSILSAWGMKVETVDTGWAALERLEKASGVDVVLIDQHMPIMDGETVVRRIRSMRYRPEPRLVMMVTMTDSGTRTRATELGLTTVVVKPPKRAQLRSALRNLFSHSTKAETAQDADQQPEKQRKMSEMTVLLADDNRVGQRVTSALLRRLGYSADVVDSGGEVLNALNEHAYDVILMDVYMPEMDGLTATKRIRSDYPADYQPYVIALTASAVSSDKQDCLNAGMDDYLSKPIGIKDLEAALDRACEQHEASLVSD